MTRASPRDLFLYRWWGSSEEVISGRLLTSPRGLFLYRWWGSVHQLPYETLFCIDGEEVGTCFPTRPFSVWMVGKSVGSCAALPHEEPTRRTQYSSGSRHEQTRRVPCSRASYSSGEAPHHRRSSRAHGPSVTCSRPPRCGHASLRRQSEKSPTRPNEYGSMGI